jgi:hypothetical protein
MIEFNSSIKKEDEYFPKKQPGIEQQGIMKKTIKKKMTTKKTTIKS